MIKLTKIPFKTIVRFMNFYPPFLGAGVKIKMISEKDLSLRVSMPLKVTNKNYVGVHFGGSLYSMTDPFFMLILMNKIGKDYIVWDKKASIQFKRPGKGTVSAFFEITQDKVEEIKEAVDRHGKWEPEFSVDIKNEDDQVVASVIKTLWVKKKN
jgi:acyl-coenzyme A thioesterase PaaI-like protein